MDAVDDFVKAFHNLEGVTLDEKEKSFRKLLHNHKALLEDENAGALVIGKVTPKTHLELLFKVDILLACKSLDKLLAILTSGNEILTSRIIKHGWFFKEAFKDTTPEALVFDLLPQLSYSIRVKVLKKLCLHLNDEDKLFKIFKVVKIKYGLKIAMPLLLRCSNENIEFVIKNNPVIFTTAQLKRFIQKAPKLLPVYVEEYIKHKDDNCVILCNKEIMKQIACVDYDVYCQLLEKYKLNVKFGRRTTKKMFEIEKEKILIDPEKYENRFEKSAFIRKLGIYGSFKSYFLKSFPEKVDQFSYKPYSNMHHTKLRFYPKSKRFQLLEESFHKVYKIPIDECPKCISTNILELIPEASRREQLAKKVIEVDDDIEFVIFQKTAESIPLIKKEINLSTNNIRKRRHLLKLLVQTCKINNDLNALKEVIKYVTLRHRNDVINIEGFLNALKNCYDFHYFEKDIWNLINELIEIYKIKEGPMYSIIDILFYNIEYCYNNGTPIDDLLLDIMKYDECLYRHIYSHKCDNLQFRQMIIIKTIDLINKATDKKKLYSSYCDLAINILSWNKAHPDRAIQITDYPIFFESLKKQYKESRYYDLAPLICCKDRSKDIIELVELYWDTHLSCNINIVLYYLKWYPTVFLNHIQYTVDNLMKSNQLSYITMSKIKKYDYIMIPQNIIKYIQGQLDDIKKIANMNRDDTDMPICENTFKILACLMNSNDYVNYSAKYKPKSLCVDMTQTEAKEIYKTQCYVITNLKYLDHLSALPLILTYCGGDFLQYVLAPLYKIFHRTPENRLQPFFQQLIKNAVSVRKHAVFLALQILDLESIKNILKSVSNVEKNDSIKKRFMLTSLNLFQQNPSNEFWDIFKFSLTFIDVNDTESFETLVNIEYVPLNYRLLYFQEIWSLVSKYNLLEVRKYSLRNKLIFKMKLYVKHFSVDLCREIVAELFLKFSSVIPYDGTNINTFIFEYLQHHESSQRFDEIINALEAAKISSFSKQDVYKEICNFIDQFCMRFLRSKGSEDWNRPMTEHFLTFLSNIYPVEEFFNEFVMIKLVLILMTLTKTEIDVYAFKVSNFIESMCETYGPYVAEYLEVNISKSLKYFNQRNEKCENSVQFIKALLGANTTELAYKVTLTLFLECNSECSEYQEVIDMFKSCKYPYIQISLRQNLLFSLYLN